MTRTSPRGRPASLELLREDFEIRRGAQFFERVPGELQLPGQDADVLFLEMALDRVTDQDAEQQQEPATTSTRRAGSGES
jgi:hypothetical protein